MKLFKNINTKEFTIFFWLILISIFGVFITSIYNKVKNEEIKLIQSSLENIYFNKTIRQITENLEPRFTTLTYVSKSGDTYQSIINKLEIDKNERKILQKTILNEKSLKILKINQKFEFKFDHLLDAKIKEFKIETDNKNEIIFTKKK